MKPGERQCRKQARLKWLAVHRDLWEDFPISRKVSDYNGDKVYGPKKRKIIELMKADGVVAKTTYWMDIKLVQDINLLRMLDADR